jgi:hypothetical protein
MDSTIDHIWRLAEILLAPLLLAAVIGVVKNMLDHRTLRTEYTETVRRVTAVEQDIKTVPAIAAIVDELKRGFHELQSSIERSTDITASALREHGESLSYIRGTLDEGQAPRRKTTGRRRLDGAS